MAKKPNPFDPTRIMSEMSLAMSGWHGTIEEYREYLGNKAAHYMFLVCPQCGVDFAIARQYFTVLEQQKRSIYCPNGHESAMTAPGPVTEEKADATPEPAAS